MDGPLEGVRRERERVVQEEGRSHRVMEERQRQISFVY
jgi:hypothetical protein